MGTDCCKRGPPKPLPKGFFFVQCMGGAFTKQRTKKNSYAVSNCRPSVHEGVDVPLSYCVIYAYMCNKYTYIWLVHHIGKTHTAGSHNDGAQQVLICLFLDAVHCILKARRASWQPIHSQPAGRPANDCMWRPPLHAPATDTFSRRPYHGGSGHPCACLASPQLQHLLGIR